MTTTVAVVSSDCREEYARCGSFDPQGGDQCDGRLEPTDEGGWHCSNCGEIDPSIDGSRCDDCGTIEEYWGGDDPVCPRCIEAADEQPLAFVYAADGQIRLYAYDGGRTGREVRVPLSPVEALILGASLINYAIAGDPRLALAARATHGETDWSRKLRASARDLA